MTISTNAATETPKFRSRLSDEDFRKLLDSASQTHNSFRNGSLLEESRSSASLTSLTSSPSLRSLPGVKSLSSSQSLRSLGADNTKRPPVSPATAPRPTALEAISPMPELQSEAAPILPRLTARLKNKVLDSVITNRLTIIVGPTGSGKSTQIPPLLLELGGAVLCTQPRRLAVVAIAKRVSQEMRVQLGGTKVGFRVGHHNLSNYETKLLFTTAGILLEELRAKGSQALSRFRVLIIDECHERSPESDLILSLVKSYLQRSPRSKLRLVLMSATFPHARYRDYFQHVPGCECVDTITLESAQQAFHGSGIEEFYLEDILLKLPADHYEYGRQMRLNPDQDLQSKLLSGGMLKLIDSLVQWLHHDEPLHATFLVFAPTYRHLGQLHEILEPVPSIALSVLHSTIDMEDCLRAIQGQDSAGKRRILLASAIADSSLTVPGVSCVIDMCRALEVRWSSQEYVFQTVWASKSICDQRRGRTGRTCPGRVFRLLHKGFYISRLPQWDTPQITLSSCHNELLGLACSKSDLVEAIPQQVLRQCLDPPDESVVTESISYLQAMGAIEVPKSNVLLSSKRQESEVKVLPTQYGEILAAFPLDATDTKVVLTGGQFGLLHEVLALRAIYNHKPLPIVQRFGQPSENERALESFYHKASREQAFYLAHFSAYMFWDFEWNRIRRRRANQDFSASSSKGNAYDCVRNTRGDAWEWTVEIEKEHALWCRNHDINPTAVRSIADNIDCTMNALFMSKFEPEWLRCSDPTPLWRRPRDWRGTCGETKRDMLHRVYGDDGDMLCNALLALLENRLRDASLLVAQIRCEYNSPHLACIHNLTGNCNYGNRCRHSHHPLAKRPPCRFYSGGSCTKGKDCLYGHNDADDEFSPLVTISEGAYLLMAKLPIMPHMYIEFPTEWFRHYHLRMLVLGDERFKFTKAMSALGMPPFLSSANSKSTAYLANVNATRLHTDERIISQVGLLDTFAWNFPHVGVDANPLLHELLLLQSFHSMALLLSNSSGLEYFTFAVTLHADQFSNWSVLRSANKTGWRLQGWGSFDHNQFPGYIPSQNSCDRPAVESARIYVFVLHKVDVGEPLREKVDWAPTPRPKFRKHVT